MRFAEQWTSCMVDRIRDVAPAIREITLKPDAPVIPYALGSHINVSLLIDGQPQTRSYSLVGERDANSYRIAVRLAPDSRGGSRAIWRLQPRARIEISNPSSLFEIDWARQDYCLIARRLGIRPIRGIASALKRRGPNLQLAYARKPRRGRGHLAEL